MFHDTLKLPLETLDNPFIAPVSIKVIESFMQKVGYQGVVDKGMLISVTFLTDEIRATDDYAEYETVFVKVAVIMNQPQPVVFTQGTRRTTPSAHETPTITAASPQRKKREQVSGETSSPGNR
nr:hypothetical protein [Tanacetum cinerariifolium]